MSLNKFTDDSVIKEWMNVGANRITCTELKVDTAVAIPTIKNAIDPSNFVLTEGIGFQSYIGNLVTLYGLTMNLSGTLTYEGIQTVATAGANQSFFEIEVDITEYNMDYPLLGQPVGGTINVECVSATETFGCNAICYLTNANKLTFKIYVDGVATQIADPTRNLNISYFLNIGLLGI